MSTIAKLFSYAVIAAGSVLLFMHLIDFSTEDPARFLCYLLIGAIASSVHMSAGALSGGLSLSFVPVLLAMLDLSTDEAIVIACVSALTHYVANEWRRAMTSEVWFRVASATIAVYWSSLAGNKVAGALHGSSLPLQLATTALAFITLSILPAALTSGLRERLSFATSLRRYLKGVPILSAGAALAGVVHTTNSILGWQMSLLMLPILYLFYRSYCLFLARLESEKKLLEETASLNLRTIEALALAVEAKDQTTGNHLQRVQIYALEVGKELGLEETELKALQAASLLHDIGKLAVPEHILSKPGKLTPEEFEKMKVHPVVGAEILERVRFPYPVVPIVRCHHEKWDGSGYPAGLSGEDIPIGARILAAVDCLDALASDRQYRRALPLEEAMEVMIRESGRSFDPQVVGVLERRYVELEQLAKAKPVDSFKLSTDVKIENGAAPGAGFEERRTVPLTKAPEAREHSPGELMALVRHEIHSILGEPASSRWECLPEALATLSQRLQKLVPHDTFVVYIRQRECLVPYFALGEHQTFFRDLEIPMGQGLSGWVAENKKAILNGSPAAETAHLPETKRTLPLNTALVVPLEGTSHLLGTLSLYHHDREGFSKEQFRALQAVGSQLAIAIETSLQRSPTTPKAESAALALPTPQHLFDQLDRELARYHQDGTPLAMFLCQLDGYAELTQSLLPAECEAVLRTVSRALRDSCRDTDFVVNTGGQEFALLVPGLRADAIDSRTRQLREAIPTAVRQLGLRHRLELLVASVRVPEEGTDAEHVLAQLDRKLQRVKSMPRSAAGCEPARADSLPETFRLQWRTTVV